MKRAIVGLVLLWCAASASAQGDPKEAARLLAAGRVAEGVEAARSALGVDTGSASWWGRLPAWIEAFRGAGEGQRLLDLLLQLPVSAANAKAAGLLARDLKLLSTAEARLSSALERASGDPDLLLALGFVRALRFDDQGAAWAYEAARESKAAEHHRRLDEERGSAKARQVVLLAGALGAVVVLGLWIRRALGRLGAS